MTSTTPAAAPAADTAPAAPAATDAPLSAASALAPAAAPAADPAAPPAADPNAAPALTMPGKDATPEQWGEFYGKLGRPETSDGYEIPVPEGMDATFTKEAQGWFHEAGLSKEQGAKIAAKYQAALAAFETQSAEAATAQAQQMHAKNTAEAAELKTLWGEQNDANMEFARRATKQFFGEKATDVISAIESKLGYKATIQMLHGIGKGLAEHDAPGMGQNNSGQSQKSLADRLYGGTTPQQ